MEYLDQYLHITHCQSGETHIVPLDEDTPLDIDALVDKWIEQTYCGELERDGELTPGLDGEYYAAIYTDGRSPESVVVWSSGGFYTKVVE